MRRLVWFIALILSFATPLFASAAMVEPSSSDLSVVPGEKAVATISVKNEANSLKNYEISFVQANFGKDAEQLSFSALSTDLKTAISASPSVFSLDAYASRTVDVLVNLPTGIGAQSPTIAILVTEKADQTSGGSVQASIASLLFLHVPGHSTSSYRVDSFVTVPSFAFGKQTMISALFTNDGDETLVLPNEIRVFGPFGRQLGAGQLSAEPKHLPPATSRGLSISWPDVPGFSRILLGPYRFELWDGDKMVATTTATFVPSFAIFGGMAIFGLLLLGIIIFVRRRTK